MPTPKMPRIATVAAVAASLAIAIAAIPQAALAASAAPAAAGTPAAAGAQAARGTIVAAATRVAPAALALTGQPCDGPSCVGQEPTLGNATHNCTQGIYNPHLGAYTDSAYDVTTFSLPAWSGGGSVTLRYSPYCAANWARWDGGNDYVDYWVETANLKTESAYSGNLPNYTLMLDGTQLARVCADNVVAQVSGCSGWY
jgi:hypothetical protein